MAKTLPQSLNFRWVADADIPVMRRRLSKVCSDKRARLIRGVSDEDQPLQHDAVLMVGSEVFGWLLSFGNHRWGNSPSARLEVLLPSPAFIGHLMKHGHFYGADIGGTYEPLRTGFIRWNEEEGESEDVLWSPSLCEELTTSLGLIEVMELVPRLTGVRSLGVIVQSEEDSEKWYLQGTVRALRSADAEIGPGGTYDKSKEAILRGNDGIRARVAARTAGVAPPSSAEIIAGKAAADKVPAYRSTDVPQQPAPEAKPAPKGTVLSVDFQISAEVIAVRKQLRAMSPPEFLASVEATRAARAALANADTVMGKYDRKMHDSALMMATQIAGERGIVIPPVPTAAAVLKPKDRGQEM